MGRQKIEARWRWAKKFVEVDGSVEPELLLRSVYETMALAADGNQPKLQHQDIVEPPHGWNDPWLIGAIHEQAVSAAERRERGAWYTPQKLVAGLVQFAGDDLHITESTKVVDPTCGGGAFLLAAADFLVDRGFKPTTVYGLLCGQDVDRLAVQVTRWALAIWAANHGIDTADCDIADCDTTDCDVVDCDTTDCDQAYGVGDAAHDDAGHNESGIGAAPTLRCGDALQSWPVEEGSNQFVVGNPPFASPLRAGALPEAAIRFRQENEDLLGPYADLAAIHLLRATQMVGEGSTVVLVQPQSVLSSRDIEPLRRHLAETTPLSGLWVAREAVFDAGVRACAPVLRTGAVQAGTRTSDKVRLASGRDVEPVSSSERASWPRLAADALGAPKLPVMEGQLADLGVSATAGFRDEYYGLAEACVEQPALNNTASNSTALKLLTVGLIDPLECRWGEVQIRFAGQKWVRPSVSMDDLNPKTASWTARQLRPKLLVATQAKVLEPVIDRDGTLVPVTPVLAVHCGPGDLDRVAAVLLAPPVVAWAWRTWFGAALSVDAVKLSAKQLLRLPLPSDDAKWDKASELVAESDGLDHQATQEILVEIATLMTDAYGADRDVLEWWLDRRGR